MNTQTLQLSELRIDGGTQPRVEMNEEVIVDYAEQMRSGITFPPVTVFFDGAAYWLADGFHRYHAHRRMGRDTMVADVQQGGLRDALLYSVGANANHGLRRTNADKRKSVETMLYNEYVSKDGSGNPWSNNEIARRCYVSEKMVRMAREALIASMPGYETGKRAFVHHKSGKPTVMNIAKMGKSSLKVFKPIRASDQFQDRAAIELSYNPISAASVILSTMGKALSIEIANRILAITKGQA
jgi:hypothetical protein